MLTQYLQPKVAVNKKQHSGSTVKIIFKPARPGPELTPQEMPDLDPFFFTKKNSLKTVPYQVLKGSKSDFLQNREPFRRHFKINLPQVGPQKEVQF